MTTLRYQDDPRFFAQVGAGIEDLAAAEFRDLGATDVEPAVRGVHFRADLRTLYQLVYCTRLAQRVVAPLLYFKCHNPEYLYRKVFEVDWRSFIRPSQTFAVFANVSHSKLKDSRYTALKVKDAVCDRMRQDTGERPSIDTDEPDMWLSVHANKDWVTVGLDLAGGSLHKRGYRVESVDAPMQETVAAAMLALAGWNGERPLHDPMCGSGTILAEAWLRATGTPSGTLRRRWGFERMPDFDIVAWKQVKKGLDSRRHEIADGLISGSDIDPDAVRATRANLGALPGADQVVVGRRDFRERRGLTDTVIMVNPPYGLRLQRGQDMSGFYKELGDWLKFQCAGCTAYIYFGDRRWLKSIGLRPSLKHPLRNGGLDGCVARYELYA